MGTIPARVGSARLTCYNAISVQLQLQLPTGTELGNYLFLAGVQIPVYKTNGILPKIL